MQRGPGHAAGPQGGCGTTNLLLLVHLSGRVRGVRHALGLVLLGITDLVCALLQNLERLDEGQLLVRVFGVRGAPDLGRNDAVDYRVLLRLDELVQRRLVVDHRGQEVRAVGQLDPAGAPPQ